MDAKTAIGRLKRYITSQNGPSKVKYFKCLIYILLLNLWISGHSYNYKSLQTTLHLHSVNANFRYASYYLLWLVKFLLSLSFRVKNFCEFFPSNSIILVIFVYKIIQVENILVYKSLGKSWVPIFIKNDSELDCKCLVIFLNEILIVVHWLPTNW